MAGPFGDLELQMRPAEPVQVPRSPGPSRVPSLQEWLATAKNALPANTPEGKRRYPSKYVQEYLTEAAKNWTQTYGKQMEGEYGLQRESIPVRPNPLKDRTETFRGDEIQQRMGYRDELHPYAMRRAGAMATRQEQGVGYDQARQGEWMDTQNLTQQGLQQQQDLRGLESTKRQGLLGEQAETENAQQGVYGAQQQRWENEAGQVGKITPYQQGRLDMESPYWEQKTTNAGQPPQVPRSALGGGGGGRGAPPQGAEEQKRKFVQARLDDWAKSGEAGSLKPRAEKEGESNWDPYLTRESQVREDALRAFWLQQRMAGAGDQSPTPDPQIQQLLQRAAEIRKRLESE